MHPGSLLGFASLDSPGWLSLHGPLKRRTL